MKQVRKDVQATAVPGVSPLLLGNCSHLRDVGTGDLVSLSKVAETRLVFEGQTLFEQGDTADSVFMLLDGEIRVDRSDMTGEPHGYDVEAPYATFGDVVLLGEEARRYTATAALDSIVVEIPLQPLVRVLSANSQPALAWRGAIMARLHRQEPHAAGTFAWRILGKLSQMFDAA